MRSICLGFAIVAVVGCGDTGIKIGNDMSMVVPNDMSAIEDMASTDISIPDDARTFVTFAMFALHYAQHVCAHKMSCGQLDAAQQAACIERVIPHTGWDQDIEIMKGRMMINEAQCLAAVDSSRCDNSDSDAVANKCIRFLYQPNQTDGASCLAGKECTSRRCAHAVPDSGTSFQPTGCAGTCAPPLNIGAACRLGDDCGTMAYCHPQNKTCTALATTGQACVAPFSPTADYTKPPCTYGLNCPTFSSTPSTCVTPTTQTTLHGPCDPYQGSITPTPACGPGMFCQLTYNGATPNGGTCEMKIASGMACDPRNEGSFGFQGLRADNQCADGTYCFQLAGQANATCQALGSASAACHQYFANFDTCKFGLYCNVVPATSDGTCVPWIADGQPCDTNAHCASSGINQAVCIAANADAGTFKTCQVGKNFGATCDPAFENTLCAPSDNSTPTQSAYCAPAGSSGICQPACF